METLECRFYPLTEIRDITGKGRSRDIKRILMLWGYEYEWKDRHGVVIIKRPEAPMERFTELMHRHLHIDSQIDPHNFACFLTLLLEDEAFSSMPWEERSWQMSVCYGVDVSERTLRNWASYLFKGDFLMKDKETRTVWCTETSGSLKVQYQVEKPDEDETYLNYLKEREEMVHLLRQAGEPFGRAYKETVCHLWEKYHRIYYFCYSLVTNAINVDELIEILRAAIQEGSL